MEILAALDLDRFPFDDLDGRRGREFVIRCRTELSRHGLFNLDRFLRADSLGGAVADVAPLPMWRRCSMATRFCMRATTVSILTTGSTTLDQITRSWGGSNRRT